MSGLAQVGELLMSRIGWRPAPALWSQIAPVSPPEGFDASDPNDPAYQWHDLDSQVQEAVAEIGGAGYELGTDASDRRERRLVRVAADRIRVDDGGEERRPGSCGRCSRRDRQSEDDECRAAHARQHIDEPVGWQTRHRLRRYAPGLSVLLVYLARNVPDAVL